MVGQPKRGGRGPKRDPIHLPRPVEEWIPLRVPVIVPEPAWQQAQERLIMNQSLLHAIIKTFSICLQFIGLQSPGTR